MTTWNLLFIISLILIALVWQVHFRARELATRAGRRTCERAGVSFLDDTVALHSLRLRRAATGRLVLLRRFDFEFATDGRRRFPGAVYMQGLAVSKVWLDPDAFEASPPAVADNVVPLKRDRH